MNKVIIAIIGIGIILIGTGIGIGMIAYGNKIVERPIIQTEGNGTEVTCGTGTVYKISDTKSEVPVTITCLDGTVYIIGGTRLWDAMTTPKHWAGEQTLSTGEKIRLTFVCSKIPGHVVYSTFIPFDAEHRTVAEQVVYDNAKRYPCKVD